MIDKETRVAALQVLHFDLTLENSRAGRRGKTDDLMLG